MLSQVKKKQPPHVTSRSQEPRFKGFTNLPMNESEFVYSLDSQQDLSHVELGDLWRECLILDEHGHQITSRKKLHQHIQECFVLETRVQLHNPGTVSFGQDITLSSDVRELIFLKHLRFHQAFKSIYHAVTLTRNQLYLTEGPFSDNFEGSIVIRGFNATYEAQMLGLFQPKFLVGFLLFGI